MKHEAPARDPYLDLLRAGCIACVVVGHFLVATLIVVDNRPQPLNALGSIGWMRWATWVFQIMPLFFIVGGAVNGNSARRAESSSSWVATRVQRLLIPTLVFLAVQAAVLVGARAGGVTFETIEDGARSSTIQLWFLVAYLFCMAVTPVLTKAYDRFSWRVPASLLIIAIGTELGARHVSTNIGWLNAATLWLLCISLGLWWSDNRYSVDPRLAFGLAIAAGVTGGLLVQFAGYSSSLVAIPGETRPNTSPPTIILACAAIGQLFAAIAAEKVVTQILKRRAHGVVTWLNARAMTVYLWHMTAFVIVGLALHRFGLAGFTAVGSSQWWDQKPLWIAGGLAITAGAAIILVPVEVASAKRMGIESSAGIVRLSAGIPLLMMAVFRITSGRFVSADSWVDPWTVACLVAGAIACCASERTASGLRDQ